jgi:hypothetical protein
MSKKSRILLLCSAVIALLAFVALIGLFSGHQPPPTPLPNPNGYDDFLKASALAAGDVGNAPTMGLEELRILVQTNAEPLRLVRLGLNRRCALPIDSAITNASAMLDDLAKLKSVARLLVAQGRLAELEDRSADAIRIYLEAIRYGNEISRGGFVIHRLVGVACQTIGSSPLSRLASRLNCDQSRALIAELEKIDSDAVPWEQIWANEKRYARYQLRGTVNPLARLIIRWQTRPALMRARDKHDLIEARLRLMSLELALRCYRSETGHGPAQLERLVPAYLSHVPLDPFSGRPLIYRASGTNWLLYSVGPDGVDDGGKPTGGSVTNKGDLFFGSGW